MKKIYKNVRPSIHHQLQYWKRRAEQIPDEELRKQALASIGTKQFHCEGGGIYALLAPEAKRNDVYTFIVAYQTISDYLDNLCDRSVSLDQQNFRVLHQAMIDALSEQSSEQDYYQYQEHRDDGGYLQDLVQACQNSLAKLPYAEAYRANMLLLCQLYCDLQVHKHIDIEKRESALLDWWNHYQASYADLSWYEFAAATGSTLGIFYYATMSVVGYSDQMNEKILRAYFPYVQGLHILLDYFIDQAEDEEEGDLNFCAYYPVEAEKRRRMKWMYAQAQASTEGLPHEQFHHMVIDGLLAIYLSDPKVKRRQDVKKSAINIIKHGSWKANFFYYHCWWIHRWGKKV
nr:tetraprenyl-beta-curcumene synthase family protein [Caldalkalibacillus salinus]